MEIDVVSILLAGFVATIAWFIVGGIVYMNPVVDKIYKKYGKNPSVKDRGDTKVFLMNTFVFSCLIQCLIFAFVYYFLQSLLPAEMLLSGLYFAVLLVVVKIIPRFIDMWMQSNYPLKLLGIEFINGSIGSFVMAYVFAVMM